METLLPQQILGRPTVVTIGNFDGVHLGHRNIIQKVVQQAKNMGAASCVVTFEPHPAQVLRPEKAPLLITPAAHRRALIESLGVDYLLVLPFSRYLSDLPPERFLSEFIQRPLSPKSIHVGYDFAFGKDRSGSLGELKKLEPQGVSITVHEALTSPDDGTIISSSAIRQLVTQGKIKEANRYLGQPYRLTGIVVKGQGRGRQIGFPTANIPIPNRLLPKPGVYASVAKIGNQIYPAMSNLGYAPTFAHGRLEFETHLINTQLDLYGLDLSVFLVDRVREETKFASIDALVEQLVADKEGCLKIASLSLPRAPLWV